MANAIIKNGKMAIYRYRNRERNRNRNRNSNSNRSEGIIKEV